MRKFFGQIVRIHILVSGNQRFFAAAVLHQCQIPAPLVFHPDSIKILRLCTQYYHNLCTVKSSKYIRLIRRAQFVLQSDASKEHLEAFLRQLVVHIVGKHTVLGTTTASIRFLVTDKYVKRLFFLRDSQNTLLNLVDGLCFRLVNLSLNSIGIS